VKRFPDNKIYFSCFSEEVDLSRGERKKILEGCIVGVNEKLGSVQRGTAPGASSSFCRQENKFFES